MALTSPLRRMTLVKGFRVPARGTMRGGRAFLGLRHDNGVSLRVVQAGTTRER